jgi:protein O-mannosyl-transferase
MNRKTQHALIVVFIILATLVVFWNVREFEFLTFDDNRYVSENPHIQHGLTWEGIKWAFAADLTDLSFHADYWQPVTMIARMVDIELFGLNPAAHHLMNVFFHVLNALLLFWFLVRATGSAWRSGTVAALFAIHPLQVEPVAWVTARKDLLAVFFGLIAMHLYLRAPKNPRFLKIFPATVAFALSIMGKPGLMMLPFVLVILDFWPLKRLNVSSGASALKDSVISKWPLFLITLVRIPIVLIGRPEVLSHKSVEQFIARLPYDCLFYLKRVFVPTNLALYGPTPDRGISMFDGLIAAAVLIGVTWWVVRAMKNRPYFFVGWSWWLVFLTPSLYAFYPYDRYMYFSGIGIFILVAWAASDLLARVKHRNVIAGALALISIGVLIPMSRAQTEIWRNDRAFVLRALEYSDDNYLAHNKFGAVLGREGKYEAALTQFQRALELQPLYWEAHTNIGTIYEKLDRYEEARKHLKRALEINPTFNYAQYNMGVVLTRLKDYEGAIRHFNETIRITPTFVRAHFFLAALHDLTGRSDEARAHARKTLELNPGHPGAQSLLIKLDSAKLDTPSG